MTARRGRLAAWLACALSLGLAGAGLVLAFLSRSHGSLWLREARC